MGTPARKQRSITSANVDPGKPASIVINKFGGLTRFCEMSGYPTSTVHGWTISGYIPAHRRGVSIHSHILGIAKENKIKLLPSDFVEVPTAPGAAVAAR